MRRRLEPFLRRWWEGDAGLPGALLSATLLPAEALYRGAVALRNRAYDRGWLAVHRSDIPVVSVGNVVAGGAGKTPVAAWIARILADEGRAPAVISRGYGADEVRLHRRWNPDVPVYVSSDRAEGVRLAAAADRRCAVLDDGFQHRSLGRDLDLVLVPVEEPLPGRLLPRGPFREPAGALRRAHRVVLTRRTAGTERTRDVERRIRRIVPTRPVHRLRLAPNGWTTLDGEETAPPGGEVLAVTGIARPRSFAELVEREARGPVELMTFPDHHAFTEDEVREIRHRASGRAVVLTEKDAVRIPDRHELGNPLRVLRLRVVEEGDDDLRSAVLRATAAAPPSGAKTDS